MIIAIGADHRGYKLKSCLKEQLVLDETRITWLDMGAFNAERSDYPAFAASVCRSILAGESAYGILLCGTGVGMTVAANRFKGIRAALAWNVEIARASKQDDNANILVLPADLVSCDEAIAMITAWTSAKFKGGRYAQRVTEIDQLVL